MKKENIKLKVNGEEIAKQIAVHFGNKIKVSLFLIDHLYLLVGSQSGKIGRWFFTTGDQNIDVVWQQLHCLLDDLVNGRIRLQYMVIIKHQEERGRQMVAEYTHVLPHEGG